METPRVPPLAVDILSRRLIANLATPNPDGSIHLVPMWFRFDGRALLLPTSGRTKKIRNLRAAGRATVMVDESRAGLDLRGVMLVGPAELVEGADALALNRSIHLKYVTAEGLELPQVRDYLGTDDVTIRLTPDRVVTWDLAGSPAGIELTRRGLARPLDA
jgi:PPOX class probable F420-dependent enzyme